MAMGAWFLLWVNFSVLNMDFGRMRNRGQGFCEDMQIPGLKEKAEVYLDDRLVPHVFARMKPMLILFRDFSMRNSVCGRWNSRFMLRPGVISELIGPKGLNYDREKRRHRNGICGRKSLKEMEKDSITKIECDAYTAGVNAYIESMKESELPVEYKLLNYKPEKWTNLKTALFLKICLLNSPVTKMILNTPTQNPFLALMILKKCILIHRIRWIPSFPKELYIRHRP